VGVVACGLAVTKEEMVGEYTHPTGTDIFGDLKIASGEADPTEEGSCRHSEI